ncbi:major facilitator superfamily MFS_1 [Beijerinckia indica subsp. indica ATCC 9039]|uniref:Major facilitator superfamily MFS_1 n=2 Tax=Beijerinckia TaxID=532 RepID=B2IFR6_BEII9|nr:major facilitator superfamily MFS_1 [Beijerinckia indica subsp. indica ATCC 9039]
MTSSSLTYTIKKGTGMEDASITQSHAATIQKSIVKPDARDLRRAAWVCSLGSALEYYDFALYSLASALIFGPLFFPNQAAGMALIASFGTYFLGFAVRPLGGILFGSLGDRLGRKFVLLTTVALMGVASTAIGLIPTFSQIGYWAPGLLVFLRLLQGLGAGAEQAGAAVLMTEYAPSSQRGFYASLPFLGIQIGTILAAVVYFVLLMGVSDITQTGLWRVPFLASAIILGVAIYMRVSLKESPSFTKLEKAHKTTEAPLRNLLKTSRRTVLLGIGLRLAENGASSIYQALAVSYIVTVTGLQSSIGALSLVVAAMLGALIVPLAGYLSDLYGRVAVYRGFAVLQVLIAFPCWWVFSLGHVVPTIIAFTIALGCATWGMFGAQAAFLPELFGAQHRYIGVSVTREVSSVLAGGLAPLIGSAIINLVVQNNAGASQPGLLAWIPLAGYVVLLSIGTIVATFFLPEPRGRDLDDIRDAINQ